MSVVVLQVLGTLLSAIAAVAAAYAAWIGPRSAAELAEKLRRDGEAADETRRLRMFVFNTLMQERARLYSEEGVKALNLIDTVFSDCSDVREAWTNLYMSYDRSNDIPSHVSQERLAVLLQEMAKTLGLASELRLEDLNRIYFPTALQEQRLIDDLQRREALRRLENSASPGANVSNAPQSISTPKPKQ